MASELDALISWSDLDAVGFRQDEIETELAGQIITATSDWAAAHGWVAVVGATFDNLWLSPPEWATSTGKRPGADAFFIFQYLDTEVADQDWWSLTGLIGASAAQWGFRARQTRRPKREWDGLIRQPEVIARMPGFRLDDTPAFFLPVTLQRSALAGSLESQTFDDFLRSYLDALDALPDAVKVLDSLLGPRRAAD